MDVKMLVANKSAVVELDATPAVRRWIQTQRKGHFRVLLEKGKMKVRGSAKRLVPGGSVQEVFLKVVSKDKDAGAGSRIRRSPVKKKVRLPLAFFDCNFIKLFLLFNGLISQQPHKQGILSNSHVGTYMTALLCFP
jgi:hypothetical protein